MIQGQTITSAGWVPIICDQATNPTCAGAGTWQYGATPVGSNASVTWTFAQQQILPNQEQSFTVATQSTSPLATYSFAISSVWNPPTGAVDHSFTGTVQVMCSLRDGSCGATPAPNASVICLPTPAPESGAAAGGFAERRKPAGSASGATPPPGSIVYVSPC